MVEYLKFGGFILVNLVAIAVAWGKIQSRMDTLEKRFDEERIQNKEESETIKDIQIEAQKLGVALWGIDGNNGLRAQVRGVISKVDDIQKDISQISSDQNHIIKTLDQINKKLGI